MRRLATMTVCLLTLSGCALTGTKTGEVRAEKPSASEDLLQEVRSNTTELGTLRATIDQATAKVADQVTADVVAKLQAEVNGLKATISTNKTVTGITGTHLVVGWCAYLFVSKIVDVLLRRVATRKGA